MNTDTAARATSAATVFVGWLVLAAIMVTLAITPARTWAAATCATDQARSSTTYATACDALAERGW